MHGIGRESFVPQIKESAPSKPIQVPTKYRVLKASSLTIPLTSIDQIGKNLLLKGIIRSKLFGKKEELQVNPLERESLLELGGEVLF